MARVIKCRTVTTYSVKTRSAQRFTAYHNEFIVDVTLSGTSISWLAIRKRISPIHLGQEILIAGLLMSAVPEFISDKAVRKFE